MPYPPERGWMMLFFTLRFEVGALDHVATGVGSGRLHRRRSGRATAGALPCAGGPACAIAPALTGDGDEGEREKKAFRSSLAGEDSVRERVIPHRQFAQQTAARLNERVPLPQTPASGQLPAPEEWMAGEEASAQKDAGGGGDLVRKARPLVLARLFTAVLTTAIPLVLARKLSLPDYGTYKQLFLVAQTLYYVLPFGMPHALYFFIPRNEQRRPFFGQTLIFCSLAGAIAAVAMLCAGSPLSGYFSNPEWKDYAPAMAAYVGLLIGACTLEGSLTTQGKTGRAAIAYLIFDGLRAVAMVAPALLGYGLRELVFAAVAFAALRYLAAWVLVLRSGEGPLFEPKRLREQLAYAAPLGVSVLIAIPQSYAHQYAVGAAVTPELFALYAVGCFQLPLVDLLYTPTSEVLMVQVGQLDKQGRLPDAANAFREAAGRMAMVFFPMAAFLVAFAPNIILILFGDRFVAAAPLFRLSAVAVLLAVFPAEAALRARNDTGWIFKATLLKAVLTVPAVFFGVRHYGMIGGLSAWAFTEVVGKLFQLIRVPAVFSTAERKVRLAEVLPLRQLKIAGLAASGALAVGFVSGQASDFVGPELLMRLAVMTVCGLLFVGAYAGGLVLNGVRPRHLLENLRRR